MSTPSIVHSSLYGEVEKVKRWFRCCHCPADAPSFVSLEAWHVHRRLVHGHRTSLPISTLTEPESLPVSTPPAPVVMSGSAGGNPSGGAA